MALAQAAEIARLKGWRGVGMESERVLWVVGDDQVTFYFRADGDEE